LILLTTSQAAATYPLKDDSIW